MGLLVVGVAVLIAAGYVQQALFRYLELPWTRSMAFFPELSLALSTWITCSPGSIARQGRERHMPLQSHIANISIMVIAVSLAVGTILQFRWWHWTSRHSL
jgi:hypothetical protein